MLGSKSNCVKFKVRKENDGKEVMVIVQADKLYRICDVIFPVLAKAPSMPEEVNKETLKAYKEAKFEYDLRMQDLRMRRQAVMNVYKGRQLNSDRVKYSLHEFLINLVNA